MVRDFAETAVNTRWGTAKMSADEIKNMRLSMLGKIEFSSELLRI